ncbi:MAG: hypothetical protein NWF03_03230 [Candidatus Bathyarchaeota archaeon]|nr:hypothetical protein [Candidatus Bathyarchaeota archaeon]
MTIDMDIVNLTLGIVGTIAGLFSLFVHLWRLKRESPQLTIGVLKCEHMFTEETKILTFGTEIELRNLGDRGTNILGIDLKFKNGDEYQNLRLASQELAKENDNVKWIRPHETIRTSQTGFIKYEHPVTQELDCIITVYHTHGAEKIKHKSLKQTHN